MKTIKMNVYGGPSCSYAIDNLIECENNFSESLCFCCLAEDVSVINIQNCDHNEFIKHYYSTMQTSALYICSSCHLMLKKIEAFRQQINDNYFKLINRISKDKKQDYRLTVTPLSKTAVTIVSVVKSDLNPDEFVFEEFHETEVPKIKDELDLNFDCELPSYCASSPEAIDNSTITENIELNIKKAKKTKIHKTKTKISKDNIHRKHTKHRKKGLSIDNIDHKNIQQSLEIMNLDQSTEKLKKKYIGKIGVLKLSMKELLKERAKKRLNEPYSKMEFKCKLCIKGFIHEYTYKNHMKNRHAMKPGLFSCDICKSVFTKQAPHLHHYRRHFKRYVCLECNKRHNDLDSISEHYNMIHTDREPIDILLACRQCDFVTKSPRKYRYHKDIHRGGRSCDKCNKTFCTLQTYTDHIRICHKKSTTTFKCDRCSKTYKYKSGLYGHKKYGGCGSESVERAYCVTCDMHFKTEKNYEIHLKMSLAHATEDAYKFICDLCKKKFKCKAALETHMIRYHLKLLNFKCTQCDKRLISKRFLQKHIDYVHLKLRPPRDKICDFCGKGFHTTQILQNHVRIHTGERPLKCPFCEAAFGHKAALYSHKKLVHKVPKKLVT